MRAEAHRGAAAVETVDVSVVIPCYRCGDTIRRAVGSVVAQTARPRELILVDDHSPDDTLAHLYELQRLHGAGWVKVIALPRNVGAAAARQAGWDAAVGTYVALLDADDAWHPRKLEVQTAWMQRHPEVALSGHLSVQRSDDAVPDEPLPERWDARRIHGAGLLLTNQIDTRAAMLRRDIPQRFTDGMRYSEDYLLWLEVVLSGGAMYCLELPLAYFYKARYGAGGLSAHLWNMEKGELSTYRRLRRKGLLPAWAFAALVPFSLAKHSWRVAVVGVRRLSGRGRPA
jgi:glycosyltransferase involved in cell wall biosynthesis